MKNLIFLLLLLSATALAQVIPPDHLPPGGNWTNIGVMGGIVHRTAMFANVKNPPYSAHGDGVTDDTAAIQNALNACPSNQFVYLPSANYVLAGSLAVPSGVSMRGDGIGKTILQGTGSGNGIVTIGADQALGSDISVTSGTIAKGDVQTTLSSVSGLLIGRLGMLTTFNDSNIVSAVAGEDNYCTYCDDWGGTRSSGQIVQITNIVGNVIYFDPPAGWYFSNALAPIFTPLGASIVWNAGLEDLTLFNPANNGYTADVMIWNAGQFWITNVECNFTAGDWIQVNRAYRGEIVKCYFHDGYNHSPGSTDNDVNLNRKTTACRIYNNIAWRGHASFMVENGSSWNAIGYNFSTNAYEGGNQNQMLNDFSGHGTHPRLNLFEMNIGGKLHPDSTHGSGSEYTVFKNVFAGGGTYSLPNNALYGALTNTPLPAPINLVTGYVQQVNNALAINDEFNNTYMTVVGNSLGSPWTLTASPTYLTVAGTGTRDIYSGLAYIMAWGFGESCANYQVTYPCNLLTNTPYLTSLIEANWDIVNNAVIWTNMSPQALPNSYMFASRPAEQGSLSWPMQAGQSYTNAALYRFLTGNDPPSFNVPLPPAPTVIGISVNGISTGTR